MPRYVALLRGINVGGNNVIRMAALRSCLEHEGFEQVSTYIQSGNVLFSAPEPGRPALIRRLERILAATFNYRASIVLRSHAQMRRTIAAAPDRFGSQPDLYLYDAMFLKEPLTAAAAIRSIPAKAGVDAVFTGPGVLYCSRLRSRNTQSQLGRLAALPMYRSVTIRNWNTTTALLRLLDSLEP